MANSPPLPLAFQKKYFEQKKQMQANQQNNFSQQSQNQVVEDSPQQKLFQKYNEGTISLQEFQQLFPELLTKTKYGGTNQTKAVQEYIAYRSSRGLSTSEAEKSLPESIIKGSSVGAGQKKISKPTTKKNSEPLIIGNDAIVGGYSSVTGESVLIGQSGKTYTQIPASFEKVPASFQQPNFFQNVPKATLPTSFIKGDIETARFTEFKPTVKQEKKIENVEPNYSKNTGLTPLGQFLFEEKGISKGIDDLEKNFLRGVEIQMQREPSKKEGILFVKGAGERGVFPILKIFSEPQTRIPMLVGNVVSFGKGAYDIRKINGVNQLVPNSEFLIGARKSFIKDIKENPSEFTGGIVGTILLGKVSKPFTRFGSTKLSRFEEIFNPTVQKNIDILPTQTVRSSYSELKLLTGKEIEVAHVSLGGFKTDLTTNLLKNIKGEKSNTFQLTGPPTYTLSPYRKAIEQKSFFVYPTEQAGRFQGLGGFAGFLEENTALSKPKTSFSILPKEKQILISKQKVFEAQVEPLSNKNAYAVKLLGEQEKFPNTVFQAVENQAKISTERQLTIPAKVESFNITNRPPSVGSSIKLTPLGKTFARRNVAPSFLPNFIKQSDFFTETQTFKVYNFEFTEPSLKKSITVPRSSLFKSSDYSVSQKNISLSSKSIYGTPSLSSSRTKKSAGITSVSSNSFSSQSRVYSPSYKKLSNSYSSPKYSSSSFRSSVGSREYKSVPFRPISSSTSTTSTSYGVSSSSPSPIRYSSTPSRSRSGVSSSSPYYSSSPPSTPKSYPKPKQSIQSYVKDIRPGFLTVLYKGGKPIKTISNRSLVRNEAIALGANFVNNITKRSFKIIRRGTATPTGLRGPIGILRPGKRDRNLFVERSRFAINTGGEKRQLKEARKTKMSGKYFNNRLLRGLRI